MRSLVYVLMIAAVASAVVDVRADEGMWMPQQVPELAARLRAMGFQGDPKAFADLTGQPMGAVVSLGGCSASFVSPDGLIESPLRHRKPAVQFHAAAQPAHGWLSGQDSRGGVVKRPRRPRVRHELSD
jgi:hypothetical protein